MAKLRSLLVFISFFLIFCNCSTAAPLRYIGEVTISGKEKISGTRIGGLSGLLYHEKLNYLIAVSDDKGKYDFPRVYTFKISLDENKFNLTPNNFIILKSSTGAPYPKNTVDFEDIGITPDGNLLLSSEGVSDKKPRTPPGIYEFDSKLNFIKRWNTSGQYNPPIKGKHDFGIRQNSGFESLTTQHDHNLVFVASEEPLLQDGEKSKKDNGGFIRIETLDLKTASSLRTYIYQLSPTKQDNHKKVNKVGLSALLALDDKNLLALERSHKGNHYLVKLFRVKLTDKCQLASKDLNKPLEKLNISACEKTLLVDFNQYIDKFNQGKVSNIEGICFGPKLKNAKRTIIIVNDNDFNKKKHTQFLAFEIDL